jgi:CRP-like cAMP-binding protein
MLESKYLKEDIRNIQKLMMIPALKNFETNNLSKLLRLSKIRQYDSNEVIIEEGARDQWLYFLLSGKVRVEKAGIQIAEIDKIGEVFGEMAILEGLDRSASVVADGPTVCLAVDATAKSRLAGEDAKTEFLLLLYQILAEFLSTRLRLTNEELVKAKKTQGGDQGESAWL